MRKILTSFLVLMFLSFSFVGTAFADEGKNPNTILPTSTVPTSKCIGELNESREDLEAEVKIGDTRSSVILGCAIKTGDIKLWMVPYYIKYLLEFVIGISGLLCVGAIVLGGFWLLFGGVSEDKDKGKKAIFNGIIGLILTLTAWGIVNLVIRLLTI